jgi:hypothetical protein
MAEFDGLDSRLRDAFAEAAEQGDSTGVADAIRSRVAAGDSGTSVAGGTAPGWGGGAFSWLPWLGLIVLAGIGGTALGTSGVFASEPREILTGYTAVLDDSAPASSCPGGPVIGELFAGDRVLAIARSEDSGHLGVRDPNDFARTLWFERSVVVVDAGQADVDSLPIDACPVATVEVIEPTPTPEPIPVPVADTSAPVITQAGGSLPFHSANGEPTTITATAFDDRGVARIDVAVFRPDGGTATTQMQNAGGGTWSYVYSPGPSPTGSYRFVLTAFDAAGNASAPVEVKVEGT